MPNNTGEIIKKVQAVNQEFERKLQEIALMRDKKIKKIIDESKVRKIRKTINR